MELPIVALAKVVLDAWLAGTGIKRSSAPWISERKRVGAWRGIIVS